jgi:hypothetical protein
VGHRHEVRETAFKNYRYRYDLLCIFRAITLFIVFFTRSHSYEEVMRVICEGMDGDGWEDGEQWEEDPINRDAMLFNCPIPFLQEAKYRLDRFLPTAPEGLTLR